MIDKHRHRFHRAPHGALSNWTLAGLLVCAVALVVAAGRFGA